MRVTPTETHEVYAEILELGRALRLGPFSQWLASSCRSSHDRTTVYRARPRAPAVAISHTIGDAGSKQHERRQYGVSRGGPGVRANGGQTGRVIEPNWPPPVVVPTVWRGSDGSPREVPPRWCGCKPCATMLWHAHMMRRTELNLCAPQKEAAPTLHSSAGVTYVEPRLVRAMTIHTSTSLLMVSETFT